MVISLIDIALELVLKNEIGNKFVQQIRTVYPHSAEVVRFLWKFAYENCVIIPTNFEKEENNLKIFKKKTHKKSVSFDFLKSESARQ